MSAVRRCTCYESLTEWYGEGTVPPIENLFCHVLVTVGGTAPSLYQVAGIASPAVLFKWDLPNPTLEVGNLIF